MEKNQLFKSFFKVGSIQIIPAFITIAVLIGIMAIVIILAFQPIYGSSNPDENYFPPSSDLLALGVFITVCLLILSGLIAFILSSAHFVRAKRNHECERLVTGMKYLNWGWILLSLFTVIMFLILVLIIAEEIYFKYW